MTETEDAVATARKLYKSNQDSVVWVMAVAKVEWSASGRSGDVERKVEALGYGVSTDGGSATIPLENLYGGERRTVLLRLQLEPNAPGRLDLGDLRLDYISCEENRAESVTYNLQAEATEDLAAVESFG